jgi:hypothetical protein
MSFCIVSAADSRYAEYLQGLLDSLTAVAAPVVVIDLGLGAADRARLEAAGVAVHGFSYPLDYPARRQVETTAPGFGAMLCRPYLNEIVRGYDVILWIDADAWAQHPPAVVELAEQAWRYGMAAVPEVDRGYFKFVDGVNVWDIERDSMRRLFGPEIASRMAHVPVVNSGVWAARADSPLWPAWRRYLQEGLGRIEVIDDFTRTVEQGAFNLAIRLESLPLRRFPASYNWLACLALPAWHAGRRTLVDPNPPHDSIRIVHVSAHLIGKPLMLPVIGAREQRLGPIMLTRQSIQALRAEPRA